MKLNVIDTQSVDMALHKTLAGTFKVLAHPARLAILDILRDDEACVCHMEALLGYRQAYISQQLAVLREAGLVQSRQDGWNIFYSVTDRGIYPLIDALQEHMLPDKPRRTGRLAAKDCPCPKCCPQE